MTHSARAIRAVGVVVPARDEEERVGACLAALRTALDQVPADRSRAVCVVLDRCTDNTAAAAHDALEGCPWPVGIVHNRIDQTVGELRATGIRRLLHILPPIAPEQVWLLSTDADSTVPPPWVVGHLRHAEDGADAVAGTVTLDEPGGLDPAALRRYATMVEAGVVGPAHTHAYAANLGVRASAYTAVGGFPVTPSGEEHGLLRRLRSAGHRVAAPNDLPVRTSARLQARASGGLADLLRGLHGPNAAPAGDALGTRTPSPATRRTTR